MVTCQSHNLKLVGSIPASGKFNLIFKIFGFVNSKNLLIK